MDLTSLVGVFTEFSSLFAFLSGVFVGDSTSLGFSFLASQGIVPLWETAFFAFLGILLVDFLSYLVGRTNSFKKFTKIKLFKKLFKRVDKTLDKISGKNPFLAIFYTKFTIGTKFLISSYLGQRKVPVFKYLISSFSASLIWALILIAAGYFAGQGFTWILTFFENLPLATMIFFLFGGIFLHVHKKAHDQVIKKMGGEYAKLSPNTKR